MIAEQALIEFGCGDANPCEVFLLPLRCEVPKENPFASKENGKLTRPDFVDSLGQYRLGFLPIGTNGFPTLPPVRPIVPDDPFATPSNDAHYAAPRPSVASRRRAIQTCTSCGSKRSAVP